MRLRKTEKQYTLKKCTAFFMFLTALSTATENYFFGSVDVAMQRLYVVETENCDCD